MTESKDSIIDNLRAIIISSKNGLKLQDVSVDYKEAFGENIPFESLGYSSLTEFFTKNPENFILNDNTVQVVTRSSSLHITSLVSRQRNTKKKGRSKLSSKEARHIRKPSKISNYPFPGVQSKKKNNQQKNPRCKENLSASLRALQLQQVANSKKIEENVSAQSKIQDKMTVEKNIDDLKDAKKENVSFNNNNNENYPGLFQDVEDLNETIKPQSRLLKVRPVTNKTPQIANNGIVSPPDKINDVMSCASSPFARSLANNSHHEVLNAKKSAINDFENKKKYVKINSGNLSPVSSSSDQEDNATYELKLKQFCIEKGLILPTYSIIVRNTNNFTKLYGCKLTMGDSFQMSTYPIETHSEASAKEMVSKKAYMQLSTNNNLPLLIYDTKNVIKLRELCTLNNLPEPIFKSLECHPKNEPKFFICKVKIGDDILLSSYPAELKNEFSARDFAAQKACDYLMSRNKSPLGNPKSESDVLTQIFVMIKSKEYGVWSDKLPNLYLETYNEEIKPNWLEIIKKSPKFEIDNIEKVGLIIRAKNCVEEDLNATEQLTLPLLKVPESDQWEVYITNVVTSAEIWCRLIGKEYSELYYNMMTKLELQPPTAYVKKPVVDGIYLVNLEESWNRVKVLEISSEKDEISVFLIDIGVDEVVKSSQLFYLPKQFFSVPPQALLLSLNELDCLVECEELQHALFHSLLGNTFIAEIVAILDEGGNVSSVNLWDTSTEDDINFNLKLLDDVIKTIKSPTLPTLGIVKEMFVSYVDDEGFIYLQKSKQNTTFIENIISIKMKYSGLVKPVDFKKLDSQKLYITRFSKNGLFCRAKLSKALDSNTAIMKFIDYGNEERIPISSLFDLEQTSFDLATIPSQAIQTKFFCKKPLSNKVVAKIREYVLHQSVLVKIIQSGYPPHVELLQRSQIDGTLSSVSSKLDNDEQLRVEDPPTRKKSYVIGLENTLSKNLPTPNIPPIGSYFNVFVTLAAHPGLFSVQPLATQNELMELMFRLQEKCEQTFAHPLSATEFKIGELYAVKHSDEFWYRAYAHAVISSSAYSVCLCDFGDFIMAPSEKIMLLPNEFKMFPYQAIRAYLAGIAPANKDWSARDCVNFRELVIEKQFVSEIKEIYRDLKNPNFISLGLTLVDTSTSEDVNINNLLVEKQIAILKS